MAEREQAHWIAQTDCSGGGCCYPISLCNALRFHGLPSPEPGTDDWERLIDVSLCRAGSALQRHNIRAWLGVVEVHEPFGWRDPKGHLPLLLSIDDPKYGYHVVLLVERRTDAVRLINYGGERNTWVESVRLTGKDDPVWVVPQWRPHD